MHITNKSAAQQFFKNRSRRAPGTNPHILKNFFSTTAINSNIKKKIEIVKKIKKIVIPKKRKK